MVSALVSSLWNRVLSLLVHRFQSLLHGFPWLLRGPQWYLHGYHRVLHSFNDFALLSLLSSASTRVLLGCLWFRRISWFTVWISLLLHARLRMDSRYHCLDFHDLRMDFLVRALVSVPFAWVLILAALFLLCVWIAFQLARSLSFLHGFQRCLHCFPWCLH